MYLELAQGALMLYEQRRALDGIFSKLIYTPGMSPDEFMRAWLTKAREDEITVVKELAPHIISSKQKKLWVLTLVTKQDLWWDRRQEVRDHYEKGEYEHLKRRVSRSGRRRRGSAVVSCSS